jgi:hypothetical protein
VRRSVRAIAAGEIEVEAGLLDGRCVLPGDGVFEHAASTTDATTIAAERRLAGLTAPHLIALSVKDTLLARQPGNDVPSCDYYYEVDTLQDPGVMRFCYRDDVLIEKSAYDMGSGVQGGDAGADICVW